MKQAWSEAEDMCFRMDTSAMGGFVVLLLNLIMSFLTVRLLSLEQPFLRAWRRTFSDILSQCQKFAPEGKDFIGDP